MEQKLGDWALSVSVQNPFGGGHRNVEVNRTRDGPGSWVSEVRGSSHSRVLKASQS